MKTLFNLKSVNLTLGHPVEFRQFLFSYCRIRSAYAGLLNPLLFIWPISCMLFSLRPCKLYSVGFWTKEEYKIQIHS